METHTPAHMEAGDFSGIATLRAFAHVGSHIRGIREEAGIDFLVTNDLK